MAEKEVIGVELGIDTTSGEKALTSLRTVWAKQINLIKQATNKSTTGMVKGFKAAWRQQTDCNTAQQQANKIFEDSQKEIQALTALTRSYGREISKLEEAVASGGEKEVALLKKKQDELAKLTDNLSKYKDAAKEAEDALKETHQLANAEIHVVSDDLEKTFKDGAKDFIAPFESLISKDLAGVLENSGKLWEKVFTGKIAKKIGSSFGSVGGALHAKGAEKAAKGGLGNAAMGGAMKAMGGVMKSVGPALNALAKIGPVLGMVGSAVMAVVKLFLDAEAGAKEFQKNVLSTASTMEFLTKSAGGVEGAAGDLKLTLKGVRDAAFDLSNTDWGLKSSDHAEVMNNLTSQGYTLAQLKKDAGGTYEGIKKLSLETVHLSVAYARNMGVSVAEMSGLWGELMGSMGQNLEQVTDAFDKMGREAADSSVSANTFFNIIRSVSADFSLFNNRMGDAVKILGRMTKVMDPRKAQQFLTTIQNFYKGQDLMSGVKSVKLAGDQKTKDILQADINMKMEGLSSDLEKKGIKKEDLLAATKGGMKSATEFLAKNADKLSAAEKEAVIDAASMQEKVTAGSTVDLASALKQMSPIAAMKMMNASARIMGAKNISELKGVNRLAAENLGFTDEMQANMQKFQVSLDLTKAEIAQRIQDGTATADDLALLQKMGIKDGDAKAKADALRGKESEAVFENMSKTGQDALTGTKAQVDYAKTTADFQTSLLDKLDILIEWFMNSFYNLIVDIYEGVMDAIPDALKSEETKLKKLQSEAMKRGDQQTAEIARQSKTVAEFRGALEKSPAFKKQEEVIYGAATKKKELYKAAAAGEQTKTDIQSRYQHTGADGKTEQATPEYMKKLLATLDPKSDTAKILAKDLASLEKAIADKKAYEDYAPANDDAYNKIADGIDKGFGGVKTMDELWDKQEKVRNAASMAGLDTSGLTTDEGDVTYTDKRMQALMDELAKGTRMDIAATQAGYSDEDVAKLLDKARVAQGTGQFAASMSYAGDTGGPIKIKDIEAQKAAEKAAAAKAAAPTTPAGEIKAMDGQVAGTPGAAAVASTSGTTKTADEHLATAKATTEALDDQSKAQKKEVTATKQKFEQNAKPAIKDATLDALRTALWEFALLTQFDKVSGWAKDFAAGGGTGGLEEVGRIVRQSPEYSAKTGTKVEEAPPKAAGGLVTGIGPNGIAITRPAPGEGLTSIGVGERIVPAGGGGGGSQTIVLELRGDLGRLIEAKAQDTIVKNMAASKYR